MPHDGVPRFCMTLTFGSRLAVIAARRVFFCSGLTGAAVISPKRMHRFLV